ncbi:hypothetical protein HK101_005185, partial [Irineochytrium annulatum]
SLNEMERLILATLNYDILYHNPVVFFHEYETATATLVDACDIDDSDDLSNKFADTLLTDHRFLAYPPSVVAGAIYFIGHWMRQSQNR